MIIITITVINFVIFIQPADGSHLKDNKKILFPLPR